MAPQEQIAEGRVHLLTSHLPNPQPISSPLVFALLWRSAQLSPKRS